MAERPSLRDRDLVQWLDNKLGAADELWSGRTAAGLLTLDIISELDSCFQDLQSHVKLRMLLAIPHLPQKSLDAWREPIDNLLSLAMQDADDWVQTVGDLLKEYAQDGTVSFASIDDASHFSRTLVELRKLARQHANQTELRLLPPDASFCSKSTINARFGVGQQTVQKHFALRRRPKSATLRADLLSKSADVASQPKNRVPHAALANSIPTRSRGTRNTDDGSPLRGIPSQNASKISGGFTNEPKKFPRPSLKRDGGAKLIEIAETPQALKRKRKEWELEQKQQKLNEKEEWKRKLIEEREAKKQATLAAKEAAQVAKDAKKAGKAVDGQEDTPPSADAGPSTATPDYAAALLRPAGLTAAATSSASSTGAAAVVRPPTQPYSQQPAVPSYAAVQTQPTVTQSPAVNRNEPASSVIDSAQKRPPTGTYSMSKEVMAQATEMFSTANKLSRPEKALILGFMAGNRENPCPQMGQVLTVRLSESNEMEPAADGSGMQPVSVETFFQMNYATGEWKRLKKVRPLRPDELGV
uniref:HDAg domain-containing protein n=1 Tax=Plectus sambesii TaxID=2011161 RepID=A0A914WGN7_9BILA